MKMIATKLFVLIFVSKAVSGNIVASFQEFNTKESCEYAISIVKEHPWYDHRSTSLKCVEK